MEMNQVVYDRTFKSLENLYINMIDVHELCYEAWANRSNKLAYSKEFSTIKLCGARQSGHTDAIVKLVLKYNGKWLILTHNLSMLGKVRERILNKLTQKTFKNCKFIETTEKDINIRDKDRNIINSIKLCIIASYQSQIKSYEFDGIIVDCASFISQSKIEELYSIGVGGMNKSKYPAFIFVE